MDHSEIRSMLRRLFAGAAIDQNNAIRSCRASLGALPLIVQAMVDKGQNPIKIVMNAQMQTGATNGNTIWLCPLPLPADDADVDAFVLMTAMAYGLCHHEVGHINATDFSVLAEMKSAKETALVADLVNIIEDVRQENEYIRRKPGTKVYLDALSAAMIVKGLLPPVTEQHPPVQAFLSYLLYRLYFEYRHDATCRELYLGAEVVVRGMFPSSVFTRLDNLLMRMTDLRDSDDTYELAREISLMLDDEAKKEAENQSSQDAQAGDCGDASSGGQGAGNQSSGQSDGSSQASQQAPGGNGNENGSASQDQAAGSQSGQSGADAQSQSSTDQGGASGQAQNPTAANPGSDTPASPSPLAQLVDPAQQGGSIGDKHQMAQQALRDLADEGRNESFATLDLASSVNTLPKLTNEVSGQHRDYSCVMSQTTQIRTKLVKEIQAKTQSDTTIGARGRRLSSSHLHRIAAGDGRVFSRTTEEIDMDTAVLLIVDGSSSMREEIKGSRDQQRIMKAMDSCFATARALEMIDGVSVACMMFPQYEVIKPFDVRRSQPERYRLKTGGSTPMDTAIYVGARLLAKTEKSRRIMLVMTDGEPDNPYTAKAAIDAVGRSGVEVMGLGMATDAGATLFDRWVVLNDLSNLPHTLLTLVRGSLQQRFAA